MAIPVEGFTVVVKRECVDPLLEDNTLEIPNATSLGDDHIWRCCFMAQVDADKFVEELAELGLTTFSGPDSDVVVVSEFDQTVTPYCEWLTVAPWDKAVVAWLTGTTPKTIIAREGWDPAVGSGLKYQDEDALEFLRLDDNLEVYLNKDTGEEVYLARTSTPVEALYQTAKKTIHEHWVSLGDPPLEGDAREQVAEAVATIERLMADSTAGWTPHFDLGKGHIALGNLEAAYRSIRKAYELQPEFEGIPRELAGLCLELGKFVEAVDVAQAAAVLEPDNKISLGNLSVAYLLAGKIEQASKSIAAALKLDEADRTNNFLSRIINEVSIGSRPAPKSMDELSKPGSVVNMTAKVKRAKRWWEFWKR